MEQRLATNQECNMSKNDGKKQQVGSVRRKGTWLVLVCLVTLGIGLLPEKSNAFIITGQVTDQSQLSDHPFYYIQFAGAQQGFIAIGNGWDDSVQSLSYKVKFTGSGTYASTTPYTYLQGYTSSNYNTTSGSICDFYQNQDIGSVNSDYSIIATPLAPCVMNPNLYYLIGWKGTQDFTDKFTLYGSGSGTTLLYFYATSSAQFVYSGQYPWTDDVMQMPYFVLDSASSSSISDWGQFELGTVGTSTLISTTNFLSFLNVPTLLETKKPFAYFFQAKDAIQNGLAYGATTTIAAGTFGVFIHGATTTVDMFSTSTIAVFLDDSTVSFLRGIMVAILYAEFIYALYFRAKSHKII